MAFYLYLDGRIIELVRQIIDLWIYDIVYLGESYEQINAGVIELNKAC